MFGTWFEEYLFRNIVGTLGYIGIYLWKMVVVHFGIHGYMV
jgi:hypothetical protein